MTRSVTPLRVGLLGWGAIGAVVGEALRRGDIAGAELAAVSSRHRHAEIGVDQVDPSELPERCELVVEAAGHSALSAHGAMLLDGGVDLLVVSVGALADDALLERLRESDRGRLLISTGAIGGIDLLLASRQLGRVDDVHLTTEKPSKVLIRPWMTDEVRAALEAGAQTVTCFAGTAREAAQRFPESLNVAAALAVAAGSWDAVRVDVIGNPSATRNRHAIDVRAESGDYHFDICNRPSPANPRSSHVVPFAVLRAVATLAGRPGMFV